ncbi:MAG TPA: DNA polymerase III subunit beta [Syntrophobacteraceae bacterium]|nr:DNA polymerase III subunit beta [Syntrophobacteraceae bacterium]
MKFQVDKGPLIQVLQRVQGITEKKTSMPILSNCLLRASETNLLEFSATDLELSIWTQTEGKVESPGATTISARKLLEIVREIPQESILMESLPNQRLCLSAARAQFELAILAAEDFPHMALPQDAPLVSADLSAFKQALQKTLYAISPEDDPFSVAGVYCQPVGTSDLRFVSSDGHRLAYVQVPRESLGNLEVGPGIIIPRKGIQEILRILERETEVSLGIQESSFLLKTPHSFLSIRMLDADYPDYEQIIPRERPFSLEISWENLHSALKRMAVFTNSKWRYVKFMVSNGTLALQAGNPELGNANDVLDVEYQGEEFSIALNVRYVLEAIQVMESREVRFEWLDAYHGAVFLGADDPGYLGLIMPMVV